MYFQIMIMHIWWEVVELLKTICEMVGVSGYETIVIGYLYNELIRLGFGDTYIDKIGNLVFYVKGYESNKKILMQAHADEVGFQVISKIEDGKYSFKSLGNIKTWNAHQQRVISDKGVSGVIYAKDGEQMKPYNYENLVLDTNECGLGKEVLPGTVFTFDSSFMEKEGCYIGKALDNRASCFCLLETIKKCHTLKNDTYFCFSVLEETNMRGARVLKSTIQPDVCITVDASGIGERNSLRHGEGVGIKISDGMGVSTVRTVEKAVSIASSCGIAYQMEVSDGGTSELVISNELDYGCEELGISIPCSYMHTANSVMYKSDVETCCELLPVLITEI